MELLFFPFVIDDNPGDDQTASEKYTQNDVTVFKEKYGC